MSKKNTGHKWTIITRDGTAYTDSGDFFELLDKLYALQYNKSTEAGTVPNMLLMDGHVVVEKDLVFMAIKYAKTREVYVIDAVAKARNEHMPDWLAAEYGE